MSPELHKQHGIAHGDLLHRFINHCPHGEQRKPGGVGSTPLVPISCCNNMDPSVWTILSTLWEILVHFLGLFLKSALNILLSYKNSQA